LDLTAFSVVYVMNIKIFQIPGGTELFMLVICQGVKRLNNGDQRLNRQYIKGKKPNTMLRKEDV